MYLKAGERPAAVGKPLTPSGEFQMANRPSMCQDTLSGQKQEKQTLKVKYQGPGYV